MAELKAFVADAKRRGDLKDCCTGSGSRSSGPAHWLDDDGKAWLRANPDKIELHRLPPYSPEFMPVEGVWKTTRKLTTHNRFFHTTEERDAALEETFRQGFRRPLAESIA